MKLRNSTFAALILLTFQFLMGLVEVNPISQAQAASSYAPQIIYVLNNPQDQAAILKTYSLSSPKALKSPNTFSAQLASGQDPATIAAQMSQDTRISSASPNLSLGYSETRSSFNFDPHSFNFD